MKRMWSRNELKNISSEEAKSVKKNISTLVDADGHDRFIEGDIDLVDGLTGVSKGYGKWSLSGTHLMLVIGGVISENTVLSAGTFALVKNLPTWVYDKIQPLFANTTIEQKTMTVYADDYSSQTITVILQKTSDRIQLYTGSLTASKDRKYRFSFDLLID